MPYWLCKVCREKCSTWPGARDHIYTAHGEETNRLLSQSMIPEMMLLEKRLERP